MLVMLINTPNLHIQNSISLTEDTVLSSPITNFGATLKAMSRWPTKSMKMLANVDLDVSSNSVRSCAEHKLLLSAHMVTKLKTVQQLLPAIPRPFCLVWTSLPMMDHSRGECNQDDWCLSDDECYIELAILTHLLPGVRSCFQYH